MAAFKGTPKKVYKAVSKKVSSVYAHNIANKARTKKGRSAMVRKGDWTRKNKARARKLKGKG